MAKSTRFKPGNKAAAGRKDPVRSNPEAVERLKAQLTAYIYVHPGPKKKGEKQLPPEPLPELAMRTFAECMAARTRDGRPTHTAIKAVDMYFMRTLGPVVEPDKDAGKVGGRLVTKIDDALAAHAAEALEDIKNATRKISTPPPPPEEADA